MTQPDTDPAAEPASPGNSEGGTTRRTILIAAVVAIVAAGIASGATAQLTSNADAGNDQGAQLAELRAQASAQSSAHAAALDELQATASEHADTIEALTAEVAALEEQSAADAARREEIQAEKVALEDQLNQLLNPPAGPIPTATVNALWNRRDSGRAAVVVCVELTNTSDADADLYYSYAQFSGVDLEDFVYPSRLHTPGYGIELQTPVRDGTIGPGERRRGELLFEVPTGHRLIRLTWADGATQPPEITIALPRPNQQYRQLEC